MFTIKNVLNKTNIKIGQADDCKLLRNKYEEIRIKKLIGRSISKQIFTPTLINCIIIVDIYKIHVSRESMVFLIWRRCKWKSVKRRSFPVWILTLGKINSLFLFSTFIYVNYLEYIFTWWLIYETRARYTNTNHNIGYFYIINIFCLKRFT